MAEKYKVDLMHLQNELLGDIKNVENKIESKLKKTNQSLDELKISLFNKLNYLENAYTVLLQRSENSDNNEDSKEKDILDRIDSLNKKMEENIFKLDNKFNGLRGEVKDANYRYDKAFADNFQIPGLIGYKGPFLNMRQFLEHLNMKLAELVKSKDKQISDLTKFKEKVDSTISVSKNQFSMLDNRISDKFQIQIKELENRYIKRIDLIEEKINKMQIENEKFSNDILAQCNDLSDKYNNMDDKLINSLDEYKAEFSKYKDKINKNLNSFQGKYDLLENRLNLINDQIITNNKISSNYAFLEKKIKEIEKKYLILKNENLLSRNDESSNKNKYLNNFDNNSNEDEEEKILFFSQRNNQKIEDIEINDELKNVSARNDSNSKKQNLKNSKKIIEKNKINNILNDSESIKKLKVSIRNLNKHYQTHKKNNHLNRIRSGKIFSHFPFISYDKNNSKEDMINILSRNNKRYLGNKNFFSKENTNKNEEERNPYGTIFNNNELENLTMKQIKNESKNKNINPNHKYLYLDKKIDILGRVMVDTFNKIIIQMNFIKKYNINNIKTVDLKSKDNNVSYEKLNNSKEISSIKNFPSQTLRNSKSFYLQSKIFPNFQYLKKEILKK